MVAAQKAAPLVTCVLLAPSVMEEGLQGRPVPNVLQAQHLRPGATSEDECHPELAGAQWRLLLTDQQ